MEKGTLREPTAVSVVFEQFTKFNLFDPYQNCVVKLSGSPIPVASGSMGVGAWS